MPDDVLGREAAAYSRGHAAAVRRVVRYLRDHPGPMYGQHGAADAIEREFDATDEEEAASRALARLREREEENR
jgi:hypothetical protein